MRSIDHRPDSLVQKKSTTGKLTSKLTSVAASDRPICYNSACPRTVRRLAIGPHILAVTARTPAAELGGDIFNHSRQLMPPTEASCFAGYLRHRAKRGRAYGRTLPIAGRAGRATAQTRSCDTLALVPRLVSYCFLPHPPPIILGSPCDCNRIFTHKDS